MDCFGGLRSEGEWDLCSSNLSLEELDFAPIIPDAWFCSLDSFMASNDQFPNCIAAADYDDIFLQEITGFCGDDEDHHRFVNMDYVQTHQGNNNAIACNNPALHHKRKSIDLLPDDDDHTAPNKKTRTSTNANIGKTKQKSSSRRRKCEEKEEENVMKSCSSTDNSSEEGGDVSPATKPKTRASRGSATDPQSLYARKRRERINERLKLLQKIVPNGTKVDISTMLEEAVHYVKFLQLQIKLLSSDELWMYAPIAYNGMDIGLQQKLSSIL